MHRLQRQLPGPHPEPFGEHAARVRLPADATGDPELALLADLAAALTTDPYAEPAAALAASTDVYERARAIHSRYAARIAAGHATLCATLVGEIDLGLAWSDRSLEQHREVEMAALGAGPLAGRRWRGDLPAVPAAPRPRRRAALRVQWRVPPPLLVPVVAGVLILVAWLVHRYVERPMAPRLRHALRWLGTHTHGPARRG